MAQDNIRITTKVQDSNSFSLDKIADFEDYNDPLEQFTFALRAPETKRQYPRRLKVFMDFVRLEGDVRQQANFLNDKIISDKDWFKGSD